MCVCLLSFSPKGSYLRREGQIFGPLFGMRFRPPLPLDSSSHEDEASTQPPQKRVKARPQKKKKKKKKNFLADSSEYAQRLHILNPVTIDLAHTLFPENPE